MAADRAALVHICFATLRQILRLALDLMHELNLETQGTYSWGARKLRPAPSTKETVLEHDCAGKERQMMSG